MLPFSFCALTFFLDLALGLVELPYVTAAPVIKCVVLNLVIFLTTGITIGPSNHA